MWFVSSNHFYTISGPLSMCDYLHALKQHEYLKRKTSKNKREDEMQSIIKILKENFPTPILSDILFTNIFRNTVCSQYHFNLI